jgi:hypothetical protein
MLRAPEGRVSKHEAPDFIHVKQWTVAGERIRYGP